MENAQLIPFEGKEIRKIWYQEQWYFSVVDVIGILTDSKDAKRYWSVLKVRENQLTTLCSTLKMKAIFTAKKLFQVF